MRLCRVDATETYTHRVPVDVVDEWWWWWKVWVVECGRWWLVPVVLW